MIGQATKRETLPSPLGALLPITFQTTSSSFPYLIFFQKLQNCVNRRVAPKKPLYACIAVKVGTVVKCIEESINLLSV